MHSAYFYDLSVYRLPEDRYYKERDEHIDKVIFRPGSPEESALREHERRNPNANDFLRNHLQDSYGGCWQFNEVIGHVRLHFVGTQVRGEYYAVAKKRLTRTRSKTVEFRTWKLAPEIDIQPPFGTKEVFQAIQDYIADCRSELPRRVVDTSVFDVTAPHVDWHAVWKASQ